MEPIKYFAYGSNMLRERLLARKVGLLDSGHPTCVEGYKLLFNKKSDDGSSKANLVAESGAKCWGVLFSVDINSLADLDEAEGAPGHYRQETISVKIAGVEQTAMTYLAQSDKILTVPDRPYDWYIALILAGAKSHADMPLEWITKLRRIGQSKPDTKTPARKTFTEAVAQLKEAGYDRWQDLLDVKPDYRLAIGYGSAWHLLRFLGWQRDRFNKQLTDELGATHITWLDFPGYTGNQPYPSGMPIRDGEWKRINFIDDDEVQQAYNKFWPGRGEQQNWDAVGKAVIEGREEWLLVEAKAHPAEISSSGTTASEDGGRPKIRAAFNETLRSLGYDSAAASALAEKWLSGHYQHANRLATLHFFTKREIPAHLVFLYFCGDQHPDNKFCPSNAGEWQPTLDGIEKCLGLKRNTMLEHRVHNIFMDVDRSEQL